MINANAFEFVHNLNDRTNKWLNNAKTQIKANGQDFISNNTNKDIWLKTEEVDATPIYDEETTAKIKALEEEIAKIKAEATPTNKGEKVIKQTVYVRHIQDDIVAEVNELLKPFSLDFDKAILKALDGIRSTKTNIH